MSKKYTFGFSPCPNDTFIFDALYNNKIDTQGIEFEWVMADVEELNRLAFAGKIDITKISYYSFAQLLGQYEMMRSGGALGSNCGPLLISNKTLDWSDPSSLKVAIPGKNTTANLLLSLAYPYLTNKTEVLFSEIESGILNDAYDLGLIIHESRFTYEAKGLNKVADLGEYWENTTQSPIPLGGICIHNTIDQHTKTTIESLIHQSVVHAFKNEADTMPFIRQHSQEMEESVMKAHIGLYVNDYSIALGPIGERGVHTFLNHLQNREIIPPYQGKVFV